MQQAMQKMRKQNGFTLIELVVVVAILGVLAVIVTPKVLGAMENARGGANKTSAKQVQLGLERIFAETGSYPTFAQLCGSATAPACDATAIKTRMADYVNLGTNFTATYVPGAKTFTLTLVFTDRDDHRITVTPESVTEAKISN